MAGLLGWQRFHQDANDGLLAWLDVRTGLSVPATDRRPGEMG
jgi:hypothetical protein